MSKSNSQQSVAPTSGQSVPLVVTGLIASIRLCVLAIALLIWSVIGFLFWVPMLVFAIARYSVHVVYLTISGLDADVVSAQLEHAVGFYVNGFRNVVRGVFRKPSNQGPGLTPQIDAGRLMLHVIGVTLFWLAALALFLWTTGRLAGLFSWLRQLGESTVL